MVEHLRKLNARPGWSVAYSVGFDLDERALVAIGQMPAAGWEAALDPAGKARDDAQVAELTGLLREGADGDLVDGWPTDMRILVRREKIEHADAICHCSSRSTATATSSSRPPPGAHRPSGSRPATGCTPGWRGSIRCAKDTGLDLLPIPLVRDQHRLGDRG